MSQTQLYRYAVIAAVTLVVVLIQPVQLISAYLQHYPRGHALQLDNAVIGLLTALFALLVYEARQARRLARVSQSLRQHHQRQGELLDQLPYAIAELDDQFRMRHRNTHLHNLTRLLGSTRIEQQIEALQQQYLQHQSDRPTQLQQRYIDADGEQQHIEWQLYPFDQHYFLIGRQLAPSAQPAIAADLAHRILENTPVGVLVTDTEQRIEYVNPAFEQVTGYPRAEVIGHSPALLNSGRQGPEFYQAMHRSLQQQGHWQGEIWNRRRDGEMYLEWLSIAALQDAQGNYSHYVGMFSEFTAQEQVKQKLRNLAYYDGLTGLANRVLFDDHLQQMIDQPRTKQLCVVFIDIDGFKRINDTLGHPVGDQLLIAVAKRLQHHSREQDMIARWGGDEFIMAIEVSDSDTGIEQFCSKHLQQLKQPFSIAGRELSITASMGVSIFNADAGTAPELIRNADIAMFQSKHQGKNRFEVFSPALHETLLESLEIEERLRIAINTEQIDVHFQPQVELPATQAADSRIIGFEALARWHDPVLGPVPPQKFIAIAEETGLIQELSVLIFRTALKRFTELQQLQPDIQLSVNLSATQLQESYLPDTLQQITDELGLDPASLKLEITEDVLMSDIERCIRHINELKALGFRVSLDDFGIGYSSLSYLRDLDIDELKIDRSFVNDLNNSERNRAIIRAIFAMAQVMGIHCIVEGVETHAQLDELQQMGYQTFQGYLFYKPVPLSQAVNSLQRQ